MSDNDTKAIDPADLVRLDAEVWFSTYGTIKDKRGSIVKAPIIRGLLRFEAR